MFIPNTETSGTTWYSRENLVTKLIISKVDKKKNLKVILKYV